MQPPSAPPQTVSELLARADRLAGMTLAELGSAAGITVPQNFKRHKGFTGQLIELWLGATAGSKPEQDFAHLGIELKTLPIDSAGKVLETTYVCFAHLQPSHGVTWQNCSVRNKLSQVLFVPVLGERQIPPSDRMIASPFLWQPSQAEEALLRQDWEELMDMISLGQVQRINAKIGQALHIRPKAADGSVTTSAIGENGQLIETRPRGFYLRSAFTQAILDARYFD